jgi:predicted acetyltransferase
MKSPRVKRSISPRLAPILVGMSVEIRTLSTPDEVRSALSAFFRSMVGLPAWDVDATAITEPGRFIGAVDDGVVVGGADAYTSRLVVPGGAHVPHAAVTHIGVLPTRRRQGILRRLIAAQFDDFARRGEIVATLRASEAVIYEQFGYGVASSARSVRVDLRRARLRPTLPDRGQVRLVDGAVTTELVSGIADRVDSTGTIIRPDGWWELQRIRRASDSASVYVAVHSTNGADDGYVVYRPEDPEHWFGSRSRTVTVSDFIAVDDDARAGLWRHLLSLDLVDVVAVDAVALDDPIALAVGDRRAVDLGPEHDETWLRLVDVEAALAARTYAEEDPVVVAVDDPQLPTNSGVYEIGPKSVLRVAADPDVTVGVAALGATYLGGTRWRNLAAVGQVVEHRVDAVRRLDVLFGTHRLPFSGTVF